jgi:hypothetical protein
MQKNNTFNPVKFNNDFNSKEAEEQNNNNINNNINFDQDIITNQILPHKQPVEDIIIGIRDLFFIILDKLENKENPLPFIFASEQRQFCFSLFLIIFGALLLFLATLMVSPTNYI